MIFDNAVWKEAWYRQLLSVTRSNFRPNFRPNVSLNFKKKFERFRHACARGSNHMFKLLFGALGRKSELLSGGFRQKFEH